MNGDQARHAAALLVVIADGMAGALGRDHDHVHVLRRDDGFEVDVEAVGDGQVVASLEVRGDLRLVDVAAELVRNRQHDQVRFAASIGDGRDPQACALGLLPARGVLAQPDDHLDAGSVEVLGVGVAPGCRNR